MNKLLVAGLASLAVALPVAAALQKGDTAPVFTAKASLAGKEFTYSLADALKEGTVVVYFYPSAYTQGCNIQARGFAENMGAFNAAKATVIGVSLDSISISAGAVRPSFPTFIRRRLPVRNRSCRSASCG
jgi:hypothetical protein